MGKLVSANELRLWLKGQQVDATATRDLLSRLSPPPTLQGLPAVAGRLAVLLDRYPWFQHRKFQALIAAAQPGLSLITLQDWNDERHEPRADFERHAIYYALASNSVTQLVEELVVIFLVVELGRPNTKHRNARIGTTCYPTFRHLLAQALANQIPADLAVTLSLRPDPKALATRWATLLPSASINRRQIMALSTMANVFNACLDFVAETDPALLRLPTSTDEHISVTTTEPTKPAKEPKQKRWRVAATGAKNTAAIIHVRAPPEALKTRSLEGRSQHRDELIDPIDLTSSGRSDTPFAGLPDLPERVDRGIAEDAYRRAYDWLFLAEQWAVLSAAELRDCLSMLSRVAREQTALGNRAMVEAAVLGILVGATGRTPAKILGAEFSRDSASRKRTTAKRDAFDLDTGTWRHRIPESERRYHPRKSEIPLLERVAGEIQLQLPVVARDALRGLSGWPAPLPSDGTTTLFQHEAEDTIARYRALLAESCRTGSRFTRARFRRALPAHLYAASGDLAATMMIAGDRWGLPTIACNYYSASKAKLQDIYLSCFDDAPLAQPRPSRVTAYVGSNLRIKNAFVHKLVEELRAPLLHLRRKPSLPITAIVKIHNALVVYTAMMVLANVAHRCNYHIERMTLQHLSLQSRTAVINDKESDRGHRGRLVALAPTTVTQVRALLSHYEALRDRSDLPIAARNAIDQSLARTSHLFFLLDESLAPVTLTTTQLRAHLPAWWTLPMNAYRHRIATRLRELDCPAEFISAHLGHTDAGRQPFGVESLLSPGEFVETVSKHVDVILQEDHWTTVCGLAREVVPWNRLAAPRLSTEGQRLERRIGVEERELQASAHRHRSARRRAGTADAKVAVHCAIEQVVPKLLTLPLAVLVSDSTISQIQALVGAEVAHDADLLAWRLNAVRDFFAHGVRIAGWKCTLPARVFRPFIEVSPFMEELVDAYTTLVYLRHWFVAEVSEHEVDEAAINLYLLGLILFGSVIDEETLFARGQALHTPLRGHAVRDAVFIECQRSADAKAEVAQIRGICAVLAARCVRDDNEFRVPSAQTFSSWLDRVLPASVLPADGEASSLTCLLSVARIAMRFEMPGVQRAVATRQLRATALSRERALDLLDGVPAAARNDAQADFQAPIVPRYLSGLPRTAEDNHDNVLHTYRHLRRILNHVAGRPKTFGDDRPALPAGTLEPKIKRAMAEALRALAQQPSASSVLNLLVAYALRLVEHGTPETSDPALDTIYDYVVTIGLRLVSVAPRQEFDALSEGDYLEIYDRAAISNTDKQRSRVLTRLAFFHRFLVSHYGAEPVDEGELMPEGTREVSVDANIITPIEYLAARTALIESIESATGEEARIRFAALITLILMWRGMARIGEIVLRRFADLTVDSAGWYLRICPSQFGRLKSFAAKRICALDDRLDDTERAWLQRWVTEQRMWLGDSFTAKLPLFPSRTLPTEPMNRAVIAHVLSQALHWATGDPNARPHWLRHGGASLTLLFCSASEAMIAAIPQSQRMLWHARAAEGAAAFRTALAGRPLASYRHLAQLRTLIGHSRITITISHYGHIFPLIDIGFELANLGDATAAEWARTAALAHDNFRQLRSRHPAGGISVAGDVARVLQHARIPRRLPSNAAIDPWQPPRITGARVLDLAPDVLARFLMRLAEGVAWAPLAQSFGMTQEQQCGLMDALLMLHERAPQAWFRKAELISMAEACSDPALIADARSLIERPYLGLPQRRLEHDLITRVWERCADRNDHLCSAIHHISEAVAYGAERRQRMIPLSSLNQLVEVTSTLLSLGVASSRIVVLHARNYPSRRVQTALARLGSEGVGIHVLPTQRISERAVATSCIAIAITARSAGQKSGASMPMHVDTLIWAFGVIALLQAINARLNEQVAVAA